MPSSCPIPNACSPPTLSSCPIPHPPPLERAIKVPCCCCWGGGRSGRVPGLYEKEDKPGPRLVSLAAVLYKSKSCKVFSCRKMLDKDLNPNQRTLETPETYISFLLHTPSPVLASSPFPRRAANAPRAMRSVCAVFCSVVTLIALRITGYVCCSVVSSQDDAVLVRRWCKHSFSGPYIPLS